MISIHSYQYVRFEVFTAVTMKNAVFWDVTPIAHVRTDILEELGTSIIRVTRIGEAGMLAVTGNRCTLCISSQCASVASYGQRCS
jgi:hypothetical protein